LRAFARVMCCSTVERMSINAWRSSDECVASIARASEARASLPANPGARPRILVPFTTSLLLLQLFQVLVPLTHETAVYRGPPAPRPFRQRKQILNSSAYAPGRSPEPLSQPASAEMAASETAGLQEPVRDLKPPTRILACAARIAAFRPMGRKGRASFLLQRVRVMLVTNTSSHARTRTV
jgi:hypothetical protein